MKSNIKTKKKRSIAFKIIIPIVCIIVALILWVGADVIIGVTTREAPRRPEKTYDFTQLSELMWIYANDGLNNPDINYTKNDITEQKVISAIQPAIEYIGKRYDCSDFRATYLLKLLFDGGEDLFSLSTDNKIEKSIKDALTGFKFWITSEGDDSMCFYSENHQALFAVVEYLSGYAYPDSVFSIDGKKGSEHMEIAKTRLFDWFDMRYKYGFSENLSNNYYPVDIAALTMLMRYGDRTDNQLMQKAKMVLDLIFLDYALNLYDYSFISPSGRAYPYNNNYWHESLNSYILVDYIWQRGNIDHINSFGDFGDIAVSIMRDRDSQNQPYYQVPQVIIDIGNDKERTVKTSSGLNLSELEKENLLGLNDKQMMYQLGMGALSNPEVIENTLDFINKYDLLSNNFLSNFKYTNIKLFRYLGLMPWISKTLKLFPNGMALQRYNVYNYTTTGYKLSTNQAYQPGSFGAQQLQMTASLPNNIVVYTNHPLRKDDYSKTPGYWAGYGVAPHAVQDKNVTMMIYNLPKNKITFAPSDTLHFTHTYFPEELFDEVIVDGNYAFGKVNDTYIALIGSSKLSYLDYDAEKLVEFRYKTTGRFDLVQNGLKQGWIYELSTEAEDGGFEQFINRIKSNSISFKDNQLSYSTKERQMSVEYKGEFKINGNTQNTEYKRIESEYVTADRKSQTFNIQYNNHSLYLDYSKNIRTEG